jgi:hypothetical protein
LGILKLGILGFGASFIAALPFLPSSQAVLRCGAGMEYISATPRLQIAEGGTS